MKNIKLEQSGRSMIEMLAVLAIIGILSVAGIAGYSKAMGKYKEQKLGDQISTLTSNIRTMYATQANYKGITNTIAKDYNLVPADMLTDTAGEIKNAMGGVVTITPSTTTEGVSSEAAGFTLLFNGLNKSACMYIVTSDWGGGSAGFVAMGVGVADGGGTLAPASKYPLNLADANTKCKCTSDTSCSVKWVYL